MTHMTDQERVSLPLDLVNDLLALCTPEDHELRERVKQAARRAQVVPHTKVRADFYWVPEKQHHVPTLLIEFEPVPAGEPCDAKGWTDRDNLAAALAAAPQPPATNPTPQGLDAQAIERAAQKLAEIAEYNWAQLTEKQREEFRTDALSALTAALGLGHE